MTRVSIQALKDELSKYLQMANGGEKIVVTDHGKPIAQLSQVSESEDIAEVCNLVRAGVATWDGGKPEGSPNPPKLNGKTAAEMVLEDRR